MKTGYASAIIGVFIAPLMTFADSTYLNSPDGAYILRSDTQDIPGQGYSKHSSSIIHGNECIWTYTSFSRQPHFYWSPDSRRLLFAQYNAERDVSLFLLTIGDSDTTRLTEIPLLPIDHAIRLTYPPRALGGWAPVSWIRDIAWTSASTCTFVFIDRGLGLDAEANVKVIFSDSVPAIKIEKIEDKFNKKAEQGAAANP
jgi:hypothetical protein